VDSARRQVAALIGSRPHEVVFTASGTEACNLAVCGSASALQDRGRRVAALSIEHAAVREPLEALAVDGWTVDWIPVGPSGRVDVDDVRHALRSDTVLVVCMWANNETGIVQPIAEVAALCAEHAIRAFVDATQAVGRVLVDLGQLPIDLLALSSHKIGGPLGAGALFVREGTRLKPIVVGGGQEMGLWGGTENVPAIAGFGAAAQATRSFWSSETRQTRVLLETLIEKVRERVPGCRVAGDGSERLCNTAQFLVPHDDEEMLILSLDRMGYAVSAGSACSAGAHRRSHVLKAMGLLEPGLASVRVSLGPENTLEEIDGFVSALASCVGQAAHDRERMGAR
jgi:cysteine desulfurase